MAWTTDIATLLDKLPETHKEWLEKPDRLTQAFEQTAKKVAVQRLSEGVAEPLAEERERILCLGEPTCKPFIREVYLLGDGEPWCYARVVVPERTYKHFKKDFDTLGDRLLGDTLLYVRKDLKRTPFEYIAIEKSSKLYAIATASLTENCTVETLWGRRSIFSMGNYPLLVTEIFMSELPVYMQGLEAYVD